MESVIIAAPHHLDLVNRLDSEVVMNVNKDGTIIVYCDGVHAYILEATGVDAEYDPEDLAHIINVIPNPRFYVVEFSDISLCKKILLAVADDAAVWVDNDHGVLLRGDRFAERLRALPDWDWRRE